MTHIHWQIVLLISLIVLSAFFSAAEIGMMSLNRYRLRHLRRKKAAAKRVSEMLERPDRLLGVILIGNNFANIFAAAVATLIVVHWFGDKAVAIATLILTFIILIFAEITPKTLAALYPERIAFICSLPLKILQIVLYPLVWLSNTIANNLLRLLGIELKRPSLDMIGHEELRTIVREATGKTLSSYQEMLLSILDLQKVKVEDIMVPRNEIMGIDLDEDWPQIMDRLTIMQHTRLPIYRETIDHVEGMLHLRRALNLLAQNRLTKQDLLQNAEPIYFVPEGTPLNVQLLNFRQQKTRTALVVDEYGDILGLITLEDILEEIVGEFTTNLATTQRNIQKQADGSYLVDGSLTIRELNRNMHWHLSAAAGPKTLSGLIVEHLETLPNNNICLRLDGYPIEIIEVEENKVKTAKIWPKLRIIPKTEE